MKLAPIADKISQELRDKAPFDEIWDLCDRRTGGELDTTQMDILSEMVEKRLQERANGGRGGT